MNGPGSVIGVDEVGRGACFGPIVTCAVRFPPDGIPDDLMARLADSKDLSPKVRTVLADRLTGVVPFAFGCSAAAVVDCINPLQATLAAMRRAVLKLGMPEGGVVIVDGPWPLVGIPWRCEAMPRADATVPEVMAASIVAKVFRDRLVCRMAAAYPGYGLERHSGYGVPAHFDAIRRLGPTRHHRMTFLRKVLPVESCVRES